MEGDERKLVEAPALEQLKGLGWSHLDGVSLAQIDAEVKQAEAVMHGFLKELGYE